MRIRHDNLNNNWRDFSINTVWKKKKKYIYIYIHTLFTLNIGIDRTVQTLQTQIRCHILWHLNRVYIVCHSSSSFRHQQVDNYSVFIFTFLGIWNPFWYNGKLSSGWASASGCMQPCKLYADTWRVWIKLRLFFFPFFLLYVWCFKGQPL